METMMITSILIENDQEGPPFQNLVSVWINGDEFKHFCILGLKGELLLRRVEQLCIEALVKVEAAE
jgi:hypothetical protein